MFFQRKLMLWAFCLWLVGLMLGACGAPTPEEEGALTALPTTIPSATHTPPPVPTDTPKPTPTNTPAPTLTNTPPPTPPSPEVIIDERKAALEDLPPKEREFQGLTFPFDPKNIENAKTRVRKFISEFNSEFGQKKGPEAFKLNIQLFPLTSKMNEP